MFLHPTDIRFPLFALLHGFNRLWLPAFGPKVRTIGKHAFTNEPDPGSVWSGPGSKSSKRERLNVWTEQCRCESALKVKHLCCSHWGHRFQVTAIDHLTLSLHFINFWWNWEHFHSGRENQRKCIGHRENMQTYLVNHVMNVMRTWSWLMRSSLKHNQKPTHEHMSSQSSLWPPPPPPHWSTATTVKSWRVTEMKNEAQLPRSALFAATQQLQLLLPPWKNMKSIKVTMTSAAHITLVEKRDSRIQRKERQGHINRQTEHNCYPPCKCNSELNKYVQNRLN